ncbi:MAG: bifunctional aldolase/short-chain dehydrogenase [Candidatus Omnitrophica bacterium]|nr:bifunctional aldolase/short-chain dehydrogenase [Candidatus Omnitrophota bacterium]
MNSRWDDRTATPLLSSPLALRVYTSRLLGQEPTLVLHGGGNTSVKANVTTLLGDTEEILYVKGSGWDLEGIEADGFAPVRLSVAKRLATLPRLSDTDMVASLRAAMLNPNAPTPSVEALLHAIIPLRYVDHTHADAVVAISNTPDGMRRLKNLYGPRVLVVPYVMPGFLLAKTVYDMTRRIDWTALEGLILMHHGVFTFGKTAKASYTRMIRLVSRAETYLKRQGAFRVLAQSHDTKHRGPDDAQLIQLARLRQAVSRAAGAAMVACWDQSPEAERFSALPHVASIATRGPLTPDHVIRTKRIPVILGARVEQSVGRYASAYREYFQRHTHRGLTPLDPAPRWAVWRRAGSITFGRTLKDARIAADIARQTMRAIQWAETLGGWRPLPARDIFEVEYWELEQAKLKRTGPPPVLQGKVAVVTGAASGIGRACAELLCAQGAVVAALDIHPKIQRLAAASGILGLRCDVTQRAQVERAVRAIVRHFGGVDILVSNAGIFPPSETIAEMQPATWRRSLAANLHSHQLVLQTCIPYLTLGIEPAVVIIASKNVPAPGPGASAYSVAKAGATQLARVAALELAPVKIRVNIIHPDQVFDTGIWTPQVLAQRAQRYHVSVEEYKIRNLLRTTITSRDVAAMACAMVGPVFAKTTGAQVPVDGGNDRVI